MCKSFRYKQPVLGTSDGHLAQPAISRGVLSNFEEPHEHNKRILITGFEWVSILIIFPRTRAVVVEAEVSSNSCCGGTTNMESEYVRAATGSGVKVGYCDD